MNTDIEIDFAPYRDTLLKAGFSEPQAVAITQVLMMLVKNLVSTRNELGLVEEKLGETVKMVGRLAGDMNGFIDVINRTRN